MVLPVLGSFLGPALFPAMNPLLTGAIGSGIGSLLQGDDLGDAIKTGLLSFAGGKLLGSLGKGAVTADAPATVSGGFLENPAPLKDAVDPFKLFKEGKKVVGPTISQGIAMAKANPLMATGIGGGALLGIPGRAVRAGDARAAAVRAADCRRRVRAGRGPAVALQRVRVCAGWSVL